MGEDQGTTQIEAGFELLSLMAEALCADARTRFVLVEEEGITLEVSPGTPPLILFALIGLDSPQAVLATKADLAATAPDALAAWQATDRLYLAAYDDKRDGATDRGYVDVVTSRRDYADVFVEALGGGQIRTRAEMAVHSRLGEALASWEACDDSIAAATREHWLAELTSRIPKARARIRWGVASPPDASSAAGLADLRRRLDRAFSHIG